MPTSRFVIVDSDPAGANSLSRALSEIGYAFPISHLDELGSAWPEKCSIFVADEDFQLEEAIDCVRAQGRYYPIIPYSPNPAPQRVVETIQAGVVSYFAWPCSSDKLASVIGVIEQTCTALFQRNSERMRAFTLLKTLTSREGQVLNSIAEGASSKEVAIQLGISPRTVEIHRSNIFYKLGVRNVVEAVRLAFEVNSPVMPYMLSEKPRLVRPLR